MRVCKTLQEWNIVDVAFMCVGMKSVKGRCVKVWELLGAKFLQLGICEEKKYLRY